MSRAKKIWWWLIWLGCKVALTLGYYRIKSALYRLLFERAYRNDHIRLFYDLDGVAHFIKPDAWRADSWTSGWDAVSYPGKAQRVFTGELDPKENFDCDDFAVWIVAALRLGASVGTMPAIKDICMMSCIWGEPNSFKVGGHNVCLFAVGVPKTDTASHGHVTVDGRKQFLSPGFYTMDYGLPYGPYESPEAAARAVCLRMSAGGGVPLVMSCHDEDIRHLRTRSIKE